MSKTCFRCGNDYEPHDQRSIAEIMHARREYTQEVRKLFGLPSGVARLEACENPAAMTWVLKAGITPERASTEYGMRWSEKMQRVLVPIYNLKREYTGLIARSVSSGPKYVMLQGNPVAYFNPVRSPDTVVITEDILSSIVCYEAGFTAFAMLGTAVNNGFVDLLSKYKNVVGWMDQDSPGQKALGKLSRRLAMYDKKLITAHSSVDPKYLTRDSIRRYLNERIVK